MDGFCSVRYLMRRTYRTKPQRRPMIIFTLTAVLVLTAAGGTFALFHAVKHAPEGYENESGFHERVEPKQTNVIASGSFPAHKTDSGWAA